MIAEPFHSLFLRVSCAIMHNRNWDDLRFVLAVIEAGSVNAASLRLAVNHATVLRRIAAFEAAFDVRIFDRNARGYRLLPGSQKLVESLRGVQQSIQSVERAISGRSEQPHGHVRVTSTDTFCTTVLPGIIAGLRRTAPLIQLDLLTTHAHLSLAQLDADITVRPAVSLAPELTGQSVARLGFAIYGTGPDIAAARRQGLEARNWVVTGNALAKSRPAVWLAERIPQDRIVAAADSFAAMRDLAAAGLGLALLPCCLGDADAGLERLSDGGPEIDVPIWVASHGDMADVPRISAVSRALVEGLTAARERLYGRGFPPPV